MRVNMRATIRKFKEMESGIFCSMYRSTDYNELYLHQDNVNPTYANQEILDGKYLLVGNTFYAERNIVLKILNFFRKQILCFSYYEERWYKNGKLHREDGPALILSNGHRQWFFDGVRQRKDGPSYISSLGDEHWLIGDVYHREDGPAVKLYGCDVNCGQEWWFNGVLHREGKPALIWPDGSKEYWVNGKRHREDGPAWDWIDYQNGKGWYLNGVEFTEDEFNQWLDRKKLNDKLHIYLKEKPVQKKNKI